MHKLALVVVVVGSASAAPAPKPAPPKESIVLVPPHLEPRRRGPDQSRELDAIVAVIETTKPALLACFTKVADDEVSANITLTVATDGTVVMVETPPVTDGDLPLSEDTAACVVHTFLKLKFDAPKERTHVIFPMAFQRRRAPVDVPPGSIVTSDGVVHDPSEPSILGSVSSPQGTSIFGPDDVRYGTIGHHSGVGGGSGTGSTLGSRQSISLGEATATGDLERAIIRRYIKRNVQKLEYCYEKELLLKKTLKGTITAAFTITGNGSVSTATASGMKNKTVESCIASVIQNIEFPKPHDGNEVTVTYPFTFTPPPPPPPKKTK